MVSIGGDPYGGWAKDFLDYWYGERIMEAVRDSEKRVRLRAEVKKNNPSMSREELNAEIRRIYNEQLDKEFDLLEKELLSAAESIKKRLKRQENSYWTKQKRKITSAKPKWKMRVKKAIHLIEKAIFSCGRRPHP